MEQKDTLAIGISEACELSGVGRTTLYAAIKAGELHARKIGRRTVILHHELVAWLDSRPDAQRRNHDAEQEVL